MESNDKLSKILKGFKNLESFPTADVDKLKKLHSKILNHGGDTFEKVATTKFIELLCIPYLENITLSKNSPLHFQDILVNKKINCTDYLSKFLQEAKFLHYEEILETQNVNPEVAKLYKEDFFLEINQSKNEIDKIIEKDKLNRGRNSGGESSDNVKNFTGSDNGLNSDKSGNSLKIKRGINSSDRQAITGNEIEIDIAIQKVRGSDIKTLLKSLEENGCLNKVFCPSNREFKDENYYNILIEVGKDAINDSSTKVIQMLKMIFLFRNLPNIYLLQKDKLKNSTIYIDQQLGLDMAHEFVFILITNGKKEDFNSIPNSAEELQKLTLSSGYSTPKSRAFKCLQILKDRIKDEFVFFCYIDQFNSEQDSNMRKTLKELDERLESQQKEAKLKQEELDERLESQQKEAKLKQEELDERLESQQKELNERLKSQQKEIQSKQEELNESQIKQKELNQRLESQQKETKSKQEELNQSQIKQKELNERLESKQKELNERLENKQNELNERLESQKEELIISFNSKLQIVQEDHQKKNIDLQIRLQDMENTIKMLVNTKNK